MAVLWIALLPTCQQAFWSNGPAAKRNQKSTNKIREKMIKFGCWEEVDDDSCGTSNQKIIAIYYTQSLTNDGMRDDGMLKKLNFQWINQLTRFMSTMMIETNLNELVSVTHYVCRVDHLSTCWFKMLRRCRPTLNLSYRPIVNVCNGRDLGFLTVAVRRRTVESNQKLDVEITFLLLPAGSRRGGDTPPLPISRSFPPSLFFIFYLFSNHPKINRFQCKIKDKPS